MRGSLAFVRSRASGRIRAGRFARVSSPWVQARSCSGSSRLSRSAVRSSAGRRALPGIRARLAQCRRSCCVRSSASSASRGAGCPCGRASRAPRSRPCRSRARLPIWRAAWSAAVLAASSGRSLRPPRRRLLPVGRPPVAWASVRRFASPCRRRPLQRPAMPGLRLPEVPARLRLLERPASRRRRLRARIGSPRPIRRSGRPARICLRSIPYRLMTSSRIRSRKCGPEYHPPAV